MKTLYVSDLDGTLLNQEARLSAYTAETLNLLIEEGLPPMQRRAACTLLVLWRRGCKRGFRLSPTTAYFCRMRKRGKFFPALFFHRRRSKTWPGIYRVIR